MIVSGVHLKNISCKKCGYRHPAEFTCQRAKELAESLRPRIVPCKYCAERTRNLGTRLCDNCWEISSRIRSLPAEVLGRILKGELK